jgi:acetyltransferase-like isoleucine patch superfamily enzyme
MTHTRSHEPPPASRTKAAGAPPAHPALGAAPAPLHGGPLTLLRFLRTHRMLSRHYLRMFARLLWHKARLRSRLQLDGIAFIRPGVRLEIGPTAQLQLGRWSWIGDDTKLRVHEGTLAIGAKSVIGQECTISAFQRIAIGRECMIADRVMLIDFDHVTADVERPIRVQGILKRDVTVADNVWIGYGACLLRGVNVGTNSVIGAGAVVTRDVPANVIAAGVPARVVAHRKAPTQLRFD